MTAQASRATAPTSLLTRDPNTPEAVIESQRVTLLMVRAGLERIIRDCQHEIAQIDRKLGLAAEVPVPGGRARGKVGRVQRVKPKRRKTA